MKTQTLSFEYYKHHSINWFDVNFYFKYVQVTASLLTVALGLAPKTSIMTWMVVTVLKLTAEPGGTALVTIQTWTASTMEVLIYRWQMELNGITGTAITIL